MLTLKQQRKIRDGLHYSRDSLPVIPKENILSLPNVEELRVAYHAAAREIAKEIQIRSGVFAAITLHSSEKQQEIDLLLKSIVSLTEYCKVFYGYGHPVSGPKTIGERYKTFLLRSIIRPNKLVLNELSAEEQIARRSFFNALPNKTQIAFPIA